MEHARVGKAPRTSLLRNGQSLLSFLGQLREVSAIVGSRVNRTDCALKTQVPGNFQTYGRAQM